MLRLTRPDRPLNDRAPWTPGDTATGTVLTLGPLLALNIYSMIAGSGTGNASPVLSPQQDVTLAIINFIITGALEAVFLIAPIFYARKRVTTGQTVTEALGLRGFHPGLALGLIILSAVGVLILGDLYTAITTALHFNAPTNVDELVSELHQMPAVVYASLIVSVLIAPVCEELFFRGFLLQGLRLSLPTWGAILVTSLIFAAAHASLGSFVLLFILAVFLGMLRVVTGSIWPGVILHTLNNAISFVYILTLPK
jgi:membrane protease YdiL (CAAX protease family)